LINWFIRLRHDTLRPAAEKNGAATAPQRAIAKAGKASAQFRSEYPAACCGQIHQCQPNLMSAGGRMPNISLDLTSVSIFALFNFAVYAVVIVVFIKAGRIYKGGIVGKSIQFLTATIGFFLLADIALFLVPVAGLQVGYTLHVVLKICALTCLAIGGLNFFAR
jgi:hypothetical protein